MTLSLLSALALATPVSVWSFDDDLTDGESGMDATAVGAPLYAAGVVGPSSLDLAGSDGAEVPDDGLFDLTNSLTVSAWVNPADADSEMAVACRWGTSGAYALQRSWCLVLQPNGTNTAFRLKWQVSSTTQQGNSTYEDVVGTTPIYPGEWTHITGVFKLRTVDTARSLFVDGVLDTTSVIPALLPLTLSSAPIGIGHRIYDPAGSDLYFRGLIDDVRLDDAALSASAIDDLFDLDQDGLGDADDDDDDGDGVLDVSDMDPRLGTCCSDDDKDDCDDCMSTTYDLAADGTDTDADGVCDASDPPVAGVLLDTDDVGWTSGGIGAPTVVYDSASGLMVMVYETNTGTAANCPVGTWGLGMATSSDGLNWTDIGGPLIAPTGGTYYSCVAAHPGLVDRAPGTLVLFFKGEQASDACDVTTPSWGCNQYTGIGRATLTWNAGAGAYQLTGPTAAPALVTSGNFGYPKGIYQGGEYHVAYTQYPDLYVARGSTTLSTVVGPVWMAGDSAWASDELRSPAPSCNGTDPFQVHVEGGASTLGRLDGPDEESLEEGPSMWDVLVGDPALRHHDALPLANGGWFVVFDTLDGPGGTNRVQYAVSDATWAPTDLGSKTCL